MADEQSIKDQIAAMEGWAIKAKQNADAGKYEDANEQLRLINTQGRRLEWRGGVSGLKHLPDMEEVEILKKRVSEARAAAQTAQSSIQHMEKIMGKEKKGSSKEEHFARERKKAQYQQEITKSLAILIEVTKRANAIAKDEPWINLTYLTRKENYKILSEFFRLEGYYRHIGSNERINTLNKLITLFQNGFFKNFIFRRASLYGANLKRAYLEGANLEEAHLQEAHLEGANLKGANLEEAHLQEAHLEGANLKGANLWGTDLQKADLQEADLEGANLRGARLDYAHLEGADLEGADLKRARLDYAHLEGANLKEANLWGVINLTLAQLNSARNWEKARNIPPDLK